MRFQPAPCSYGPISFSRSREYYTSNGQSTHETLAAAARLSKSCGLDATIIPNWGELQIQTLEGGSPRIAMVAAGPTGAPIAGR
jgi:hypothetical protein